MIKKLRQRIEETVEQVLIYQDGAELEIGRKYLEQIVQGRKKSTIRDKVRIFPPNCTLFLRFSSESQPLKVVVDRYEVKRLKDLTKEEIESDGFSSREVLLAELRQYYPLLSESSIITVVHFGTGR